MDFSINKQLFNINNVPEEIITEAISEGEKYLGYEFSPLTASLYSEFSQNGNRTNYEDICFARRLAVNNLFLAEYFEKKQRFLPDLINGVWSICEESSWCIPAHNNNSPLPDIDNPIIDLFAAQTASQLGIIAYFADDVFDKYSNLIKKRIKSEIQKRMVTPFLENTFWWMGYGKDRRSSPSNWTAWCASTCLCACLTTVDDSDLLNRFAKKIIEIISYYIEEYPQDGGCDEGADYWYMSAGCMFDCLELLYRASNGEYNKFDNDKIRAMGDYICNSHLCGEYFINFADCSVKANKGGARTYLFGKRTGSTSLLTFGAEDFKKSSIRLMPNQMNLLHKIFAAEFANEIFKFNKEFKPIPHLYTESLQLFKYCSDNISFCIKGGSNGDNHNHNDVGSFMVYCNGQPCIIDVGVESYSKKTFSAERYTIWTMQSAFHNLPTINGIMQKDGKEFCASEVNVTENSISFDMSGAYPKEADISYWKRSAVCENNVITITDDFKLNSPSDDVYFSLMTPCKPCIESNTIFINGIKLSFDCDINAEFEEIKIPYDAKLTPVWGKSVFRIQYRINKSKLVKEKIFMKIQTV